MGFMPLETSIGKYTALTALSEIASGSRKSAVGFQSEVTPWQHHQDLNMKHGLMNDCSGVHQSHGQFWLPCQVLKKITNIWRSLAFHGIVFGAA